MKNNKKQFEKWAFIKLKKMQKILLLEDHTPLKFEYNSKRTEVSECQFVYPYKMITVRYSNNLYEDWKKKDYERVLAILMHEMCHPITDALYAKACSQWPSKEEIEDERERLTDHIANIVLKITTL